MNVEDNSDPFSTPIRKSKKRTTAPSSSSSSSSSSPSPSPCSHCAYLFHNPDEIKELHTEIEELNQIISNLLKNVEDLKNKNIELQKREISMRHSIQFISQTSVTSNTKFKKYKNKTVVKKKMCWKRR